MGNIVSRSASQSSRKRGAEALESTAKRARTDTPDPETKVGITAFVNPDLPGFRGIIKNRYGPYYLSKSMTIVLTIWIATRIFWSTRWIWITRSCT